MVRERTASRFDEVGFADIGNAHGYSGQPLAIMMVAIAGEVECGELATHVPLAGGFDGPSLERSVRSGISAL